MDDKSNILGNHKSKTKRVVLRDHLTSSIAADFGQHIFSSASAGPRHHDQANVSAMDQSSSTQQLEDMTEFNPLDLFCTSIDALRGTEIDQTISPESGWSSRPTKLSGIANHLTAGGGGAGAYTTSSSSRLASMMSTMTAAESEAYYEREEMKSLCRRGIPPSLRRAAWIINVVAAANPDMAKRDWDDFGTFRKVRVIEHGWDLTLKSLFPDATDLDRAEVLDFGLGHDNLMDILHSGSGTSIPLKGIQSLTKVLHAARDSLGLEFCPLLPDVTCILLSYMPESYAFATIRQMVHDDSSYFLAISRVQHLAWCKTFADLMHQCFPQTAIVMESIGALDPIGLVPILKRFFIPLLRRDHVLRVMDIFTAEGAHAIFRIGTTLCCLAHAHLGESVREHCDNTALFWEGVRRFTHSKHFRFDIFLSHQAYGVQKSMRLFTRPIFPGWEVVSHLISNNEAWAEKNVSTVSIHEDRNPLGLMEGPHPIELVKHSPERLRLAQWLPPALQSTKLDLVYSSNHHGRSLDMFYHCCSTSKHTLTIMEVLGTDRVIGMYATQTWHNNPDGYGDGGCFLFRLKPNPERFRYSIGESHISSFDDVDVEPSLSNVEDAGQLMISSRTFISMGVGEGGASGLRLNEDLTRGSTSKSIGSENDVLVAEGVEVFDVGLVEVYRFIRDVDNKPVDKVDPWKGLFD